MNSHKEGSFVLFTAEAQCLKKDGVCIAAVRRGATLCLQGCVEVLVLIGVMEVNGFLLKQERRFRALYSPSNSSHLTLTALDISCEGLPCNKSALLDGAKSSRFYPASQQATPTTDEMRVDLEPVDAERLNAMIAGGGWTDVSLVVLLRGIDSTLTRCLEAQDGALPSFKHSLIPGFQLLDSGSARELAFTRNVHQLASDVMAFSHQSAPVVVVSGVSGSGKSTLCRYLVNYLLNRHPAVGYLECDVGQTEFTVPGVCALHVVKEPLLGPPYTHLQRATWAYYYGSKTPKDQPGLYAHITSTLFEHFTTDVRKNSPHMPLIVNTCGWLTDLGVPIFLELLQTIRPTHLVKFEQDVGVGDVINQMSPIPVWDDATPSGSYRDISGSGIGLWGVSSYHDDQYEPIVYCLKPHLRNAKNSKLMRKLAYIAYFSPIYSSALDMAPHLEHTVDIDRSFLLLAPPKSVSWSRVAVHVLHRKVPSSQLLYALNGKFVALGCVGEEEVVSYESRYPGMVKTLCSQLPLVKFIGLGLLRGIDVDSRCFYITTPEDSESLSRVNVLVLDQAEDPDSIVSRKDSPVNNMVSVPYHSAEFTSCDIGQYCWKP